MEIIESAGRAPSLKLYPGICLTTEGKAGKTSVRVRRKLPRSWWQQSNTHLHNNAKDNTRQNTQNETYIIIDIANKRTHYILKNIQTIPPYIQ